MNKHKVELRECKYHGLTEYIQDCRGHWRCKKCRMEHTIITRKKIRLKLIEYKGGKCEICGYDKCSDALEFHHLNPEDKCFCLSNNNPHGLKTSLKEADKCILVCANCHRELHSKMHRQNINYEKADNKKIIETIKELCGNNKTVTEISKELEIPRTTITNIIKNNNIPQYKNENPLKNLTLEIFISLYRKYKSLVQVGKCLNVSDNSIRKWLKKNGIAFDRKNLQKYL